MMLVVTDNRFDTVRRPDVVDSGSHDYILGIAQFVEGR